MKGGPYPKVSTIAQEFLKYPDKVWWNDENPKIQVGASYCPKFLIWGRAMLLSEMEKGFLKRASVLDGVLASLYQVKVCWPLLQAFISFWNSDGHTLVTPQGEMGYPLLALQGAMSIPIS